MHKKKDWLIVTLAGLLPMLVAASIWWPVVDHFRRPAAPVTVDVVEVLRRQPDVGTLDEIAAWPVVAHKTPPSNDDVLRIASDILDGRLALPGHDPVSISLPFEPADLRQHSGRLTLRMASLIVPDYLLKAHELSGEDRFFNQARDTIFAWQRFEAGARLPRGSMWDRNAIAARIFVLTRFWQAYRLRDDFSHEAAERFLASLVRDAELLLDPAHYGYEKSQGLMQNVALLQIALAFPALPRADDYRQTAIERIDEQLGYHVTAEGIVQEHSAGYHAKVLAMLALAMRQATLLKEDLPAEWRNKYTAGEAFYGALKRPDATLPMFGDTENRPYPPLLGTRLGVAGHASPLIELPDRPKHRRDALWPVTGYATLWQATADTTEQTVVVWADFPSRVHKHADALAVFYWTDAGSWLNGVGYLTPGGGPLHRVLRGWAGTNAPHPVGAGPDSRSMTTLHSYVLGSSPALIDLEREDSDGYRARRQFVRLFGGANVVIDASRDEQARDTRVIWTVPQDVRIQPGRGAGHFILERDTGAALDLLIAGDGLRTTIARGSDDEPAGWIIDGQRNLVPTDALVISGPSNTPILSAWGPHRAGAVPALRLERWSAADDWSVSVVLGGPRLQLARKGLGLTTSGSPMMPDTKTALRPGPAVGAERSELETRFAAAVRRYPRFREYLPYRRAATGPLLGVGLLQGVATALVLRRFPGTALRLVLPVTQIAGWLAVAGWLHFVYFA